MPKYNLKVNGVTQEVEAPADMPLLWALRDLLGLTGAKYGCGIGSCGACTVLKDDHAIRSCQTPISEVGKSSILTIEGLGSAGTHPVQVAWMTADVPQCGYCQAGQVMSTVALLKEKKSKITDKDIDDALGGNLCRCGTYERIRQAVKIAATGAKK